MGHNGQDKSGNALKYSLFPLMLGIALIFFLYRGCDTSVIEAKPVQGKATTTVVEDEIQPERPIQPVTIETVVSEDVTVANDSLQAAE